MLTRWTVKTAADIKNIGILHNREFMDGVLKLELYNENDASLAQSLLRRNHYDIVVRN